MCLGPHQPPRTFQLVFESYGCITAVDQPVVNLVGLQLNLVFESYGCITAVDQPVLNLVGLLLVFDSYSCRSPVLNLVGLQLVFESYGCITAADQPVLNLVGLLLVFDSYHSVRKDVYTNSSDPPIF